MGGSQRFEPSCLVPRYLQFLTATYEGLNSDDIFYLQQSAAPQVVAVTTDSQGETVSDHHGAPERSHIAQKRREEGDIKKVLVQNRSFLFKTDFCMKRQ